MIVNLTKEQIKFLEYLCYNVQNDYEHYSVKEQKERESMASDISGALLDAFDNNVDEEELDELAENYRKEMGYGISHLTHEGKKWFKAGYHKAKEE